MPRDGQRVSVCARILIDLFLVLDQWTTNYKQNKLKDLFWQCTNRLYASHKTFWQAFSGNRPRHNRQAVYKKKLRFILTLDQWTTNCKPMELKYLLDNRPMDHRVLTKKIERLFWQWTNGPQARSKKNVQDFLDNRPMDQRQEAKFFWKTFDNWPMDRRQEEKNLKDFFENGPMDHGWEENIFFERLLLKMDQWTTDEKQKFSERLFMKMDQWTTDYSACCLWSIGPFSKQVFQKILLLICGPLVHFQKKSFKCFCF